MAIPEQFRLPLHGKMASPTAVPSPTQRRFNLGKLLLRRRRRIVLALLSSIDLLFLIWALPLLRQAPASLSEPVPGSWKAFAVAMVAALAGSAALAVMLALQAVLALFSPRRDYPVEKDRRLLRSLRVAIVAAGLALLVGALGTLSGSAPQATQLVLRFFGTR
jgi:hypothetical protein